MASHVMKYPRYADRCRNFEKKKKLKCYICPESLQNKIDTWDKHVTDPQHLSMIECFNKSFCETKFQVVCKLCSKSFAKGETVKHAISHQFSPWHKPKKLHFIFIRHFIAHIMNKYYCHLCKEQFSFWHTALSHVNDPKHRCLQRDKISEDIDDKLLTSAPCYESLINHSVFPKNSLIFECMVCDRSVAKGNQNVEEHIKGKRHRSHEDTLTNRLKSLDALEKQEVVNGGSVTIGKRKKKSKGKRGGSTAPQTISSKKKKPKKSEQRQANKSSGAATPEVHAKPSVNTTIKCAGKMTPGTPSSKASPAAHQSVLPNRQLGRVIYRPENMKACIPCRKCNKKVKDHVELHVHLTNHFWPLFIQFKDVEGDQLGALTNGNDVDGSAVKDEDAIQCQENYPSVTNVAALELRKLTEQLGDIQTFSGGTERNVAELFKQILQINGTMQVQLESSGDEQQIISDSPMTEKLDPAILTFKGTSRLQFLENLNKQLAPISENARDASKVISKAIRLYESPPKINNNEAMSSKNLSSGTIEISKKERDVQYSGSNHGYIYKMDNQQQQDIELGIILSFTRDKNNIYCMICRKNVDNSIQNIHEHMCNDKHNDYLKQMRQDELRFETFPDTFSDLHLALHFMEETSEQYVQCWACDKVIQNDFIILKQHMKIDEHQMNFRKFIEDSARLLKIIKMRMTRNWYNVQHYWCVICGVKSPSEFHFVKHLDSMKHNKNCYKFKVFENLMFDFCPTCATLWLGFQCTFAYHCECKMHKYHVRDNFYHVTHLPNEAKNFLKKWPNMYEEILRNIDQDLDIEKIKQERLMTDLLEVAQEEFYRAKIYPFGSRISGLALKNSDFDVFIDCDNMYNKKNALTKVKQCLKTLEGSLKNRPKTWKINRTVIDNVKVPIIKVYHRPTGIECDVSVTNGLSVENTQLIRNYIEMYPLCRNLIIFMKKWINACDLTEPNGWTSYAVVWMVIYYLQKQDILPSVAELIRLKGKSKIVAGWETGVETNHFVQDTRFSFIQLVQGFFNTYSRFDYQHDVICPLLGESVKKQYFEECKLPEEMWPYMSHVSNQMNSARTIEEFCIDAAICIQDPFDLSRNLTKNIKKFLVHRLRVFCSMSAEML